MMILIFIGISQYGLYLITGTLPFNGVVNAIAPVLPSDDTQATFSLSNPPKIVEETVYKWIDENGTTHFSKTKPAINPSKIEIIAVSDNVNIIESPPARLEPKGAPKDDVPSINSKNISYSPENIQKLIKDAQNLQDTLNQRYQAQDDILNNP